MIDRDFSQFHGKNHVTGPKITVRCFRYRSYDIRRNSWPESVPHRDKMTNVRQKQVNRAVFKIKKLGLRLHFCRYEFIHGE